MDRWVPGDNWREEKNVGIREGEVEGGMVLGESTHAWDNRVTLTPTRGTPKGGSGGVLGSSNQLIRTDCGLSDNYKHPGCKKAAKGRWKLQPELEAV